MVNGKEDDFQPLSTISKMESYWENQERLVEDSRTYEEIDAALQAYALDCVGTIVLDRWIDLRVAKCKFGADGSVAVEVGVGEVPFISPAIFFCHNQILRHIH